MALAGCAMVKLHGDAEAFYSSTVLVGRIEGAPGPAGPIVVAARAVGSGAIAHHTMLHGPGGYELIVPKGDYDIVAFGDANADFAFDAGEASGRFESPGPVHASGTGTVFSLDITLANRSNPPLTPGSRFAPTPDTQAGAIATLDSTLFDAAHARQGYWEPMAYFREAGGNVHFLEPYDARRTPVLFVHGAGGSARDWRYFVEHLDHTRYQAWLFHYPSGASVESMSHLLFWKLFNLQLRHRFTRMHLTAHSMGGLVARKFLVDHGAQFPYVKAFVSLSTPWAGEALAELGVRRSPAVIPSWRDMQPEGAFMRELFARPLPPGVEHYLFFGHKGGYSITRPNNDGAVTLASQLRPDAQGEARSVVGFEEDHTGILSSPRVFLQYQAVLDRSTPGAAAAAATAGNVRLRFTFEGDPPVMPVLPVLMLAPAGGGERTFMALARDDEGREVGPFAPGTYDASLVAEGYRSVPARARVVVSEGEAPTVRFRLSPQGSLSGYYGISAVPVDRPAGSYRRPGDGVPAATIVLEGKGQRREVRAGALGTGECIDLYLAGRDCAAAGHFWFADLPAGEYRLSVAAEGFRRHEARHVVVPGRHAPLAIIELEPLR